MIVFVPTRIPLAIRVLPVANVGTQGSSSFQAALHLYVQTNTSSNVPLANELLSESID